MQSFLVALIAAAIATQTGALQLAPTISSVTVIDGGPVVGPIVTTPTVAVALLTAKAVDIYDPPRTQSGTYALCFPLYARAADVCGFPVVPLYSNHLNDHIFSTDAVEIKAMLADWRYIRTYIIASVYSNTTGLEIPNAIPLYKLHSYEMTDHLLTTSFDEVQSAVNKHGYIYQGITAYVYPEPQVGCVETVPLYTMYNTSSVGHIYSLSKLNANSSTGRDPDGYLYQGIMGYVFAP